MRDPPLDIHKTRNYCWVPSHTCKKTCVTAFYVAVLGTVDCKLETSKDSDHAASRNSYSRWQFLHHFIVHCQ